LAAVTLAVPGVAKMLSCVRAVMFTFSVQLPVTLMLLGPAKGREARAAVMVVNAPGVAPEQSTTAPAANARLEGRHNTKHASKTLGPKQRSFIFFLALLDFEFVKGRGQNYKTAQCVLPRE
jgi:hypothetical protein